MHLMASFQAALWGLCLAWVAVAALADTTDLSMDAPAAAGVAGEAPEVRQLQRFTKVQIKVPFNVLVVPGARYQLSLEAEQAVREAIVADVSDGSLSLGTSGPFSTTRPVKVTVGLPADQLQVLNLAGSAFAVVVHPGFNVSTLELSNAGTSRIAVQNLTASSVRIISAGVGQVAVAGDYADARVTASGTGSVYVSGVTGSVAATVSGIGNLFVEAANPGVTIDATIFGLGKVEYNQGQCKGSTNAIFGSTCQRSSAVAPPSLTATWTCGIQVTGVWNTSGSRAGGATPLNICNTTRAAAAAAGPAAAPAAAPAAGTVTAASLADTGPVSRAAVTAPGTLTPQADAADAADVQLVNMNGVVMNGVPLGGAGNPYAGFAGGMGANGYGNWGTGNGQGNGGTGNGIGNIGHGNGNGNGNGRRRR